MADDCKSCQIAYLHCGCSVVFRDETRLDEGQDPYYTLLGPVIPAPDVYHNCKYLFCTCPGGKGTINCIWRAQAICFAKSVDISAPTFHAHQTCAVTKNKLRPTRVFHVQSSGCANAASCVQPSLLKANWSQTYSEAQAHVHK